MEPQKNGPALAMRADSLTSRSRKGRRRYAIAGVALVACVFQTGCGKNEPPKEKIVNAIAAVLPAHYKIEATEVEFIATGEKNGTAKAKLQVSPKEDLYVSTGTDSKVLAIGSKDFPQSEVNAPMRAANQANVRLPGQLREVIDDRMRARNDIIRKSNQPWIKLSAKAGSTVTIYGTAAASYQLKEWRISDARLEQDVGKAGAPRSAFPADAIVSGSPEATSLAEEIAAANAAIDQALAEATDAVNRAIEEKRKDETAVLARKEAIEQDRQKSILAAVAKGRRYSGRCGTSPIAIEFIECNAAGTLIRARVSDPANPSVHRFFTGRANFDADKARGTPVKLEAEQPSAKFDNVPGIYSSQGVICDLNLTPTAEGLEGNAYSCGGQITVAKVQ